jgi:hypothetical protein
MSDEGDAITTLRCSFRLTFDDAGRDIRDLDFIDLRYEEHETIAGLIARAEEEFGTVPKERLVVFGGTHERDGVLHSNGLPVAVVDETERFAWIQYHDYNYTIGSLKKAHADGIFDGDPEVLVWELPHGNGGIVSVWADLIDFLYKLGGVYGGLQALRTSLRIGRSAVEHLGRSDEQAANARWLASFLADNKEQWEERGASVGTFLSSVLRARQWESGVLRRRLSMTLQDSDRFLRIMGYEYSPVSKEYELSSNPRDLGFRKAVLEQHIGHDPATWEEDIRRLQSGEL